MTELAVSTTAFSATEKSLAEAEKLIEGSLTDAEKLIMGIDEEIEKPLSNGFSKDILDDSITEDDNFSMKLMLSDDESDPKTPKPVENTEVILNGTNLTESENKEEEALTNGKLKENESVETIVEKGSVETILEEDSDQINKDKNEEKDNDQNSEKIFDEVKESALEELPNTETKLEEECSNLENEDLKTTDKSLNTEGELNVEEAIIQQEETKEEKVKEGNVKEVDGKQFDQQVSENVEKVNGVEEKVNEEKVAVEEKIVEKENVVDQIDETIKNGTEVPEESSMSIEEGVKKTTEAVVDDVLKSIDDVLNDEIPSEPKIADNEVMDTDSGIDKVEESKETDELVEPVVEKLLDAVVENLEKITETDTEMVENSEKVTEIDMEVEEMETSNTEPVDMDVENELVTETLQNADEKEKKTENDASTKTPEEKSEQDTSLKQPVETLDSLIEVNQELTNAKIREMEEEDIQDLDEENKPEDEESEVDDQTAATSTDITEDEDFSQDATPQILNVGTLEENSNDPDNDPDDPDYEEEEEEDGEDENINLDEEEEEDIGLEENLEIEGSDKDESVADKDDMDIERGETDIEKDDENVDKDATDIEKDDTDIEKDEEKDDTVVRKDGTVVEKDATVVDKDETVLEKDKRKLDLDQEDECGSESKRRKTDHGEGMEVELDPKEAEKSVEKIPEVNKENKLTSKQDGEKKSEENVKKVEKKREIRILNILPKIFKDEKIPEIDIEEFILTKLIEAISQRTELAILRVKAQKQETIIDQLRKKTAHLSKQLEDISTVTNRLQIDLQQKDRPVAPVKITRSVGLQVAMPTGPAKRLTVPPAASPVTKKFKQKPPNVVAKTPPPVINKTPVKVPPKPVTPVKTTPVQLAKTPPTVLNKTLPRLNPPVQKPVQKIVQKPSVNKAPVNKAPVNKAAVNKPVIDLTDEEDPKKQAPGLIPLNAGNIRMVSVSNAGANTNSQNVTYLMAAPGQNRQLLIATSNANIGAKPTFVVSQNSRGQTQTPTRYMIQNGQALVQRQNVVLANGVRGVPVRMNTRPVRPPSNSHPAALPIMLNQPHHPSWKQIPPRPSLRISRGKDDGIQLSWLMPELDPKVHEEVVSYQLYAYQEGSAPPSPDLWRKVGDVKALPLPMACTLTSFHPGNKYYFAVRAIDNHSRVSQFSYAQPISLLH